MLTFVSECISVTSNRLHTTSCKISVKQLKTTINSFTYLSLLKLKNIKSIFYTTWSLPLLKCFKAT